jgi:ketosteroid isomerase-like protein
VTDVSSENVELVRRLYTTLGGRGSPRDFDQRLTDDALAPFFDPQVEWIPVADSLQAVDRYHGFAGVRRVWSEFVAAWDEYQVEPLEFHEARDRVAVVVHIVGHTKGLEIDETRSSLLTIRDGLVVRVEAFAARDGAREAIG